MSRRYVGLWHGGASYAEPCADDAEWFDSIRQAANAVWFRQTSGAYVRATFRYVFRETELVYVPNAHDDNSGGLTLYRVPSDMSTDAIREMIERDGYPDRLIEFGPRGGIVVNHC